MSTILIIVLLAVVLLLGVSFALGRRTEEVEAARDTEYLELEGVYIRYNVMGGGPPVLLVHGWLSSSRIWDQLAGRLAQRFTVYTLDLTGFGDSDKPLTGYGVRYGGRLLYAFCAHFGLTRTSIVGHDIGGDMAAKLAADHPDVVGRLVLVATPADDEQIDFPTPLWLATLPVIGPIFYSLGRLLRPIRKLWLQPFVADPDDLTEDVLEDAGRSTPAAVSRTLNVTRREISGGRLARQARIIKVPILLIAGEEDQIVDPQSVGSWARTADQAEVCLIDDCGHMPMIERTAEFNAHILAFLTGDARYLDYVGEEEVPAQAAVDDEEPEDAAFDGEEPEGEPDVPPERAPEPPAEDAFPPRQVSDETTVDLPLRRRRPPQEPDGEAPSGEGPAFEGPDAGAPKVHRRREEGFFEEESGDSSNGTDERPRRPGREDVRGGDDARGEGLVPEVPTDLFKWPDAWQEYRPGERSPERPQEPSQDEGPLDGPDERP